MASVVGDCEEASGKENVEYHCDEAEEGNAAEEEGEDDAEDGVQNGGTAHAFNCFLPCWNVGIVLGEDGEEVGVDA